MELTDTHCHIHFKQYKNDFEQVIEDAKRSGVTRLICVGTTLEDSQKAIEFAENRDSIWATAGVHPHDAKGFLDSADAKDSLAIILNKSSIIAIGEIGLDFFKLYSDKEQQQKAFRQQLELGLETGLPFIFHVRDAWEDFWRIIDGYRGIRGVVHSFSANESELEETLSRGFFVGLNGIMTFTKDERQLEAAKKVPTGRLLLETDAPFLAPAPERGTRCEPKHLAAIAEFLAELRGESPEQIAKTTTKNATELFNLG